MTKFIWALIGLLVGSWVVGFVLKIAEDTIHLLLVAAGILGLVNLMRGSQSGPATE